MGHNGANCAPVCAEDIESVDERIRELFFAFFGEAPRIEQNAAEGFAVLDGALFDHFDYFREFNEAELDVLIVLGVGIASHKALG
jgi:hypothetical protein